MIGVGISIKDPTPENELFAFLAKWSRRFGLYDLAVYYEECQIRVFEHRGPWATLKAQADDFGRLHVAELTRRLSS